MKLVIEEKDYTQDSEFIETKQNLEILKNLLQDLSKSKLIDKKVRKIIFHNLEIVDTLYLNLMHMYLNKDLYKEKDK